MDPTWTQTKPGQETWDFVIKFSKTYLCSFCNTYFLSSIGVQRQSLPTIIWEVILGFKWNPNDHLLQNLRCP